MKIVTQVSNKQNSFQNRSYLLFKALGRKKKKPRDIYVKGGKA